MKPIILLEALLKKAAPGEWSIRELADGGVAVVIPGSGQRGPSTSMAETDARLIVLLRNNAPAFLELAKATKDVLDQDLFGPYEDRLREAAEAIGYRFAGGGEG